MTFVERVCVPVALCVGLSGCGDTSPREREPTVLRFSNPVVLTKGTGSSTKVLVADANADGWLDVLTWGEGAPYINLAIPEQGLSKSFKLAGLPGGPIRQAAWLDVTGDQRADIVVLDESGALRRFRSDKVDEYSERPLGLPAFGAVEAFTLLDLNRDAVLDFVLLTSGESGSVSETVRVAVVLGTESGGFEVAEQLDYRRVDGDSAQATAYLQPTDINGDGRWDIAVGMPGVGVGWLEQLDPGSLEAGAPEPADGGADAGPPQGGEGGARSFRFRSLTSERDASGVWFVDYDDDGDVDGFQFSSDETRLLVNQSGEFDALAASKLPSGALGCVDDFDNDGRIDVLAVKGNTIVLRLGTSKPDKFTGGLELAPGSNLPISSIVCVDLDNDGDLDLVTGGKMGTGLYLNRLEPLTADGANYFDLRFEGADGNAAALGTSIDVRIGKRAIRRELFLAGQPGVSASPTLHLGLGTGSRMDRVEITWPNGETIRAEDWTVNDTVTAKQ